MGTYTQVRYFAEEDMTDLDAAIPALVADWEGRRPHVHPLAAEAGTRRLEMLTRARTLLVEPVPRSFGG